MKILPTTKWIMTWLCMYPASELSSTRTKILYNVCGATMFGINLCSVLVCIAFIWKNVATDLLASLFAFLGAVTFGSSLYAIPIAIFSRYQAHSIFEQLSAIYEASKCSYIFIQKSILKLLPAAYNLQNQSIYVPDIDAPGIHFLIQANSISEWIWPLAIKLTLFYDFCNTCVSVATAIYCLSIYGYIKSDRVFHSMNVMYVILTVNNFHASHY